MRCPECGYELGDAPDFTRCPECGTTSDIAERLPSQHTPPGKVVRAIALGFIPAIAGGLVAGGAAAARDHSLVIAFWLLSAVGGSLLVFVNTFLVLGRLMREMPRRTRRAPMLLLVPRESAIKLLGAGGAAFLALTLGSAACAVLGAMR
ncbi:MAG: hypothetical protein U0625_00895 [Phycisphaerales bacterium]